MIEWATTALAVTWLAYRLVRLLWGPLDPHQLGLHLPPVPVVVIDVIGPTGVVLHWEVAPGDFYYVVMLDGQEVAKVAGKTQCRLNNLPAHQVVCIEVVAVNLISQFRLKLVPVYVEPLVDEAHIDRAIALAALSQALPLAALLEMALVPPSQTEHIKLITEAGALQRQLDQSQGELTKLAAELEAVHKQLAAEMADLEQTLQKYKAQVEEENDIKMKKDMDIKLLEKRKNELLFAKSKLKFQLTQIHNTMRLHEKKVSDVKDRAEKMRKLTAQLLGHEANEQRKLNDQRQLLQQDIDKTKQAIEAADAHIKQLNADKRAATQQAAHLRKLVEQNDWGAVTAADDDLALHWAQLAHEEDKWRRIYRQEVKKYVAIHQLLEMARHARNPAYTPQRVSEYSASVEFGDALPKKRYTRPQLPDVTSDRLAPPAQPSVAAPQPSFHNHYEWVYAPENVLPAPPLAPLAPEITFGADMAPMATHGRLVSATQTMMPLAPAMSMGLTMAPVAPVATAATPMFSPPLAQPVPEAADPIHLDPDLLSLQYQPAIATNGSAPLYLQLDYHSLLYGYALPHLANPALSPPALVSLTPVPPLWNDLALNLLLLVGSNLNIWALDDARGNNHGRTLSLSLWKHDIRLEFSPFGPEELEEKNVA